MLKPIAVIFGIVFIAVGILGFIPALTPNSLLLGIFMVDPIHNTVHILSGVIALIVSTKEVFAKLYFQIFGIIYALVAALGFISGGDLFLMHVNMADNWLHVVIAVITIYLGFCVKPKAVTQ